MTISSVTSKVIYVGTGSTAAAAKIFAYPFKINLAADLTVTDYNINTSVGTVKTLDTDYAVSGVGSDSGGNVTLTGSYTNLSTASWLVIQREVDLTQGVDYVENDPFSAATHEGALDKLCMTDQQLQEQIDRCIKADVAQTSSSVSFVDFANKATQAASSATVAVAQASAAVVSASNASTSESNASSSATLASNSAVAASSSATVTVTQTSTSTVNVALSSTSAVACASSATVAVDNATAASSSATVAVNAQSSASTSQVAAGSSATVAVTQASNAAVSAVLASNSAVSAAASAASASFSGVRVNFGSASLSAGVLDLTHSKALGLPYSIAVHVFDSSGYMVIPDNVTGSTNTVHIALSTANFTVTGTWSVLYIA